MKIQILIIIVNLLLFYNLGKSQNVQYYIQLEDPSGIRADNILDSLEMLAQEIKNILPIEYQEHFKVFDFGFYLHHGSYSGGYPEAFRKKIIETQVISPYYLLFGKQNDPTGIYTKFWVDLKLPDDPDLPCLTQERNNSILQQVKIEAEKTHKEIDKNPFESLYVELKSLKKLKFHLEKAILCCQPLQKSAVCTNDCIYSSEEMAANLINLGFSSIEGDNVILEDQNYSGLLTSDHRIIVVQSNGTEVDFTHEKILSLGKLSQRGDVSAQVIVFDNSNCNDFTPFLENIQSFINGNPCLNMKINKLYEETIIVLKSDFETSLYSLALTNVDHYNGLFSDWEPIKVWVYNSIPEYLADDELEKAMEFAKEIYQRNGIDNIEYILVTEAEAEALTLSWHNHYFKMVRRTNPNLPVDHLAMQGGQNQKLYKQDHSSKEGWVNNAYFELQRKHRSSSNYKTSRNYALGYLLAHETLHSIKANTIFHRTQDWNQHNRLTGHYNEGEKCEDGHYEKIPNLNMDGNFMFHNFGGIPKFPENGNDLYKERIINAHKFYIYFSSWPENR